MVSSLGLHLFLYQFGYCTNLILLASCKLLPNGKEAQGIAKDILAERSAPYRQ